MTKNILIFGASITYGAWDLEKGGWVQRLRDYLEKKHELGDYFIYNLGISGDTSSMLLARFATDIKYRVDEDEENIVIFSVGINDSAYLLKEKRNMTKLADYEKNTSKLFGLAKKYTQKIIFVGLGNVDEIKVAPVPWNKNISYSNKNIFEYNDAVRKICKKENVLFVDLFNKIDKNLLSDGLHPNSAGHLKMFEIIKDALIKNKVI